jgi:predicted DNA-binding protein with PD1-like motif
MQYIRTQNTIIARLDPGDEVLTSLLQIAAEEKIRAGSVKGLGASKDFDVSVYNLDEKKYYPNHCSRQSEITSLFGVISVRDGRPFLHVHMQAMTYDGAAIGGHLTKCVINATCELIIEVYDAVIERKVDQDTGLTVMKL